MADRTAMNVCYRRDGGGEPIVLLADLLDDASSWARAGYTAALRADCLLLSIDLPGQGCSARPGDVAAYRADNQADNLVAVLDAESLACAHLWAYGTSAPVAYATAIQFPDRVASVIIGGFGVGRPDSIDEALQRAWWGALAWTLRSDGWQRWSELAGSELGQPRIGLAPRVVADRIEGLLLGEPPDLAAVTVPALLYAGSCDPAIDRMREDVDRLGAPLAVLDGLDRHAALRAVDTIAPLVRSHLMSVHDITSTRSNAPTVKVNTTPATDRRGRGRTARRLWR